MLSKKEILISAILLIFAGISACSTPKASPFVDEYRIRAEETYNASAMNDSLEQILEWHQKNQTGINPALNPGIDRAAILDIFAQLPCLPTEELLLLWSWHNGAQEGIAPFFYYHNFLSVENAISEYKNLTKNPLISWQNNWIPVFEFNGEWYFVECYEDIRPASPVGYYFIEDTDNYYSYLSLTILLETAAAWFNQDAIIWDEEQQGILDDFDKIYDIHQKLNEGAQFP